MEGSYTVEAAFILPLVFALLYAMLYLGFCMHDDTILNQAVFSGAFWSAAQVRNITEEETEDYIKKSLGNRLITTKITGIEVELLDQSVSIRARGRAFGPIFIEGLLKARPWWDHKASADIKKPQGAAFVRMSSVVFEKIKGIWPDEKE